MDHVDTDPHGANPVPASDLVVENDIAGQWRVDPGVGCDVRRDGDAVHYEIDEGGSLGIADGVANVRAAARDRRNVVGKQEDSPVASLQHLLSARNRTRHI